MLSSQMRVGTSAWPGILPESGTLIQLFYPSMVNIFLLSFFNFLISNFAVKPFIIKAPENVSTDTGVLWEETGDKSVSALLSLINPNFPTRLLVTESRSSLSSQLSV